MEFTTRRVPLASISPAEALRVGELIARVWPKVGRDAEFRAQQLIGVGQVYQGPADWAPCSVIVSGGTEVVGHAMTEVRSLGTTMGDLPALALSKVCAAPELRGAGIGLIAVRAAFEPVDAGRLAFALFQTSSAVRPFYEKLGACVMDQVVINSLAADPEASPFWDEVVMRYPSHGDWPPGVIDLRGPGY